METNDKENSQCGLQAELVTYLYAEATPAERERFETHLLECTPCTDEFAELSNARFSVFEWQREEFAPLATPKIESPYPVRREAAARSGLRSLLDFGWPAFAMAAVILVTLFGFGIWVIQPTQGVDDQVARNEPVNPVTPRIETAKTVIPEPANVESKEAAPKVIEAKAEVPKKAVTRISRPVLAKVTNVRKLEKDQTVAALEKGSDRLPHLVAATDEEDGSLRLADLFDNLEDKQ